MPDRDALTRRLLAEVDAVEAELVEIRRDVHAHPELSWHEERTTDVVAKRMLEEGLEVRPLSRNGLVVDIGAAPRVALRADIDALPVADRTADAWASTVDGVAHACGHDVHTAGLIGAGLALRGAGAGRAAAGRGAAGLPAGRGDHAGRRAAVPRRGRPRRGRAASSWCTATPPSTWARWACATAR